jgi:hypothetical protein
MHFRPRLFGVTRMDDVRAALEMYFAALREDAFLAITKFAPTAPAPVECAMYAKEVMQRVFDDTATTADHPAAGGYLLSMSASASLAQFDFAMVSPTTLSQIGDDAFNAVRPPLEILFKAILQYYSREPPPATTTRNSAVNLPVRRRDGETTSTAASDDSAYPAHRRSSARFTATGRDQSSRYSLVASTLVSASAFRERPKSDNMAYLRSVIDATAPYRYQVKWFRVPAAAFPVEMVAERMHQHLIAAAYDAAYLAFEARVWDLAVKVVRLERTTLVEPAAARWMWKFFLDRCNALCEAYNQHLPPLEDVIRLQVSLGVQRLELRAALTHAQCVRSISHSIIDVEDGWDLVELLSAPDKRAGLATVLAEQYPDWPLVRIVEDLRDGPLTILLPPPDTASAVAAASRPSRNNTPARHRRRCYRGTKRRPSSSRRPPCRTWAAPRTFCGGCWRRSPPPRTSSTWRRASAPWTRCLCASSRPLTPFPCTGGVAEGATATRPSTSGYRASCCGRT